MFEQAPLLFREPVKAKRKLHRRPFDARIPIPVWRFMEQWMEFRNSHDLLTLDTAGPFRPSVLDSGSLNGHAASNIVNLKRFNDIPEINAFLDSVNTNMRTGGCFVGCMETAQQHKEHILKKFIWPLNKIIYLFYYLAARVWPKLPYLKQLYFLLFGKENRAVSDMEIYGRLYAAGFSLLDIFQTEHETYFAVKKVGQPDNRTFATYGPLIRLKRMGRGGKIIKVYKLRTMFPYAEYLQQHVYERRGLQNGGKMKDDPRVNAAGFFLRKYWLDELPMLINLLKGDLKLFGVRPLSQHYLSLYPKEVQEFRMKFKPGLIPPFYADMPKTLEEIVASEMRYLKAYERRPWLTDFYYFYKAFYNIGIRQVRSL